MRSDKRRNRARRLRNLLVAALLLGVALSRIAHAVPELINYQGELTDSSGNPLSGTFSITFRIYNQATYGIVLWQETHSSAQVQDGVFNALLGSVSPFPATLFDGDSRWLAIKVGSDSEMTPRSRIASVAYAIRAEKAAEAATADYAATAGSAPDEDWGVSGTSVYLATGNVGIGTTSPECPLHVKKLSGDYDAKIETDAGDVDLVLDSTSGNSSLEFQRNGNPVGFMGYDHTHNYLYMYEGTGKVVMDNGKLGLGTDSPTETLDVEGSMKVGASGTAFLEIREITGTTDSTRFYRNISYPTGYTMDNTRVLCVEIRSRREPESFAGLNTAGVQYWLVTDMIQIIHDSQYLSGQPYRVVIMRMK